MDKRAQFVQGLRSCFTVQLFEKRTGLSVEWLADHVKVTPSDDPDAGPMQWPIEGRFANIDFVALQAAALVVLWWRDALADAPFLTDAQRDALTERNLVDEERARAELERSGGGDTRAQAIAQLQKNTRRHIEKALAKEPNLSRPAIFEKANAFLKAGRSSTRSDQTLARREWLGVLLPEAKTGPKRR